MPSLSEAYRDSRRSTDRNPRRVYAGGATFLAGAVALVAAILVVTTPLSTVVGAAGETASQRLAGILAGLGAPAVFLGVVTVLPAGRRARAGVVCGSAVAVAGVGLFAYAYPGRWTAAADPLVFETAVVYFGGGCLALWFVLVAIANTRVRNDPHGTVTVEMRRNGGTHTVEVTREELRRYRSMAGDGGRDDEVVSELRSNRRE